MTRTTKQLLTGLFGLAIIFSWSVPVRAARVDELKDQIEEKQGQIEEIEKDIKKYQVQLQEVGAEKRTLQGEVQALDISRKKVEADIAVTEGQIDATVYNIERLTIDIEDKKRSINLNTNTVAETIRRLNEAESQTFVETILAYDNLSEAFGDIDALQQFQSQLSAELVELNELKKELESTRSSLVAKETELSGLRNDLAGRHEVIASNKAEKDRLLDVTENKEASYQALLQEKVRQREAFEAELRNIEEQLRITIDPTSLPSTGSGILKWPLDEVKITQYFGNTPFASANPQIYSGAGHNGIDLGTPRGTRVKSALAGTVLGTGNTDAVAGCYSYGKWVVVRHNNNLATLYAHLDVINVSKGQSVSTGETIGFSGNTGFSTGPHLHFTVYAADGVRIQQFSSSINCKNAVIPIAPREAYLNPLSYL